MSNDRDDLEDRLDDVEESLANQDPTVNDHRQESIRELKKSETVSWVLTTMRPDGGSVNLWYAPNKRGDYPEYICMLARQIQDYHKITGEPKENIAAAALEFLEKDIAEWDLEYSTEGDSGGDQ